MVTQEKTGKSPLRYPRRRPLLNAMIFTLQPGDSAYHILLCEKNEQDRDILICPCPAAELMIF